jgi:5-oxoprolinase (ATP-hydrolysing)
VWCGGVVHRNLKDNLSDLKAQVAANTQGVALMHELIAEYGIEVRVMAVMIVVQWLVGRSVGEAV